MVTSQRITQAQYSRSRPVLVTFSVLAGAQVIVAGATLGDVVGPEVAGLVGLVIAAVQAGLSFYVHNQVTPWKDVVAKETPGGSVVAGPAAPSTPVGYQVEVKSAP